MDGFYTSTSASKDNKLALVNTVSSNKSSIMKNSANLKYTNGSFFTNKESSEEANRADKMQKN